MKQILRDYTRLALWFSKNVNKNRRCCFFLELCTVLLLLIPTFSKFQLACRESDQAFSHVLPTSNNYILKCPMQSLRMICGLCPFSSSSCTVLYCLPFSAAVTRVSLQECFWVLCPTLRFVQQQCVCVTHSCEPRIARNSISLPAFLQRAVVAFADFSSDNI